MVRKDLTGKHFGEWDVLEYLGDRKYLCRCSCGTERAVAAYSLTSGKSKNCGNKSKHIVEGQKQFKDLTGKVFGELTAIEYEGNTYWKCRCLHGHETSVSWKHLNPESTCKTCRYDKVRKQKSIEEPIEGVRVSIHAAMLGSTFRDLTVIKDLGNDRWLCRCKCGVTREVRGYDLRHPFSDNAYKCKHAFNLGEKFGKLTVIGRKTGGICVCQCECGNIKEVRIGNLLNGSTTSCGCSVKLLYTRDEIIKVINNYKRENGIYPFPYDLSNLLNVGMTTVYNYIHDYGLESYVNTYYGSVAERDIAEHFKSKFKNVIIHDRKTLNGIELDIYLPDKRIAIEFNGNYWHSANIKGKRYHQEKSLKCAANGIQLIHIFEYEWADPKLKDKITSLFNRITGDVEVHYARNTLIKEITNSEALEFEDKNHLQGRANAEISLGLFNIKSNELLGIMTFGKPRFTDKYEYELVRMCYKLNTLVVGGSEKLFKYFLNNYDPSSIFTYCALSKFSGKTYINLGFKLCKDKPITDPNYVWVSNHSEEVITRYNSTKQKLLENGLGTPDMTEDEIMEALKYNKLYDSGNLRFEYWR